MKELDEHPDTVFTVLTGEGRFFSAGADVRGQFDTITKNIVNDLSGLILEYRFTASG